jgi:hypothetical protein
LTSPSFSRKLDGLFFFFFLHRVATPFFHFLSSLVFLEIREGKKKKQGDGRPLLPVLATREAAWRDEARRKQC